MKTTRREFLTTTTTAALGAGLVAGVVACSDSDTTGAGGGAAGGCTTTNISDDHGHALTVSQADVDAAVDKTYSIAGASPHDHSVTITAAEFGTLAGGSPVTITSSDAGPGDPHTHMVTVSCA